MKEKYLPIGSVVILKDNPRTLMITTYLVFPTSKDAEPKMYDYGACYFPEGIIESNHAIAFNHSSIKEVVHLGLENEEQKKLNDILIKSAEDVKKQYMEEMSK